MGIAGAMKKGLEITTKSLLLCLVAIVVLFVGYMIVGFILGGTILTSKFPPITPEMTQEQMNALDWSQVKWAIFIPGAIIAFLLGFLLNSFTCTSGVPPQPLNRMNTISKTIWEKADLSIFTIPLFTKTLSLRVVG